MGWANHDPEILEELREWNWEEYEKKVEEVYPYLFKKEKEEEDVGV